MTNARIANLLGQAFVSMMKTNPPAIREPFTGDMVDLARRSMDPRRKQGRLQPWGSSEDTRLFDMRTMESSLMERGFFIDDEDILAVITRPEEFNRAYPRSSGILYGRTPYMRAVVHQVGLSGCMAACSAMMCLDHRIEPNWYWVKECDLAKDEELMEDLARKGLASHLYKLSDHLPTAGKQMETLLTMYHAGIINIDWGLATYGGHVVVLDYFAPHANLAVFREPFHGWCLATTAVALLRFNPASFLGVKE